MDELVPKERPEEVGPLIERLAAYDLLWVGAWLYPEERPPEATVRPPPKERPDAVE